MRHYAKPTTWVTPTHHRKLAVSLFRPTPLKLGVYYATLYVGSGVGTPYISVWLRGHGLTGGAIGVILAAPMLARVISGPAMAVWADGFELRRTALILMGGLSALGYGLLMATSGFWPWLAAWFLGVSAYWVCSPLADVITLRAGQREGFAYAFPRGVGSAAYVIANVVAGALIPRVGPDVVVWWITAAAIANMLGAWLLLPAERVVEDGARLAGRERLAETGRLLRDPTFMLMVLSVALIQAAHAFYYAFSTLIWRAQGIQPGWSGLLWGLGVAVEVLFLWLGEPLRRRLGARRLLVLGGVGSLVRWTALAFSPPLWLLFPLQALHALSFTATFVASLELTEAMAPRGSASSAQSVNAGLSFGLMTGAATLLSGPLYDHVGPFGYLAMSGLAALGLAGAWRLYRRPSPTAPARMARS